MTYVIYCFALTKSDAKIIICMLIEKLQRILSSRLVLARFNLLN